jgi:hypothetical protein
MGRPIVLFALAFSMLFWISFALGAGPRRAEPVREIEPAVWIEGRLIFPERRIPPEELERARSHQEEQARKNRIASPFFLGMTVMMWGQALATSLASVYRHPLVALAPRYRRRHGMVGGVMAAAIFLLGTWLSTHIDCAWWVGAVFVGFFLSIGTLTQPVGRLSAAGQASPYAYLLILTFVPAIALPSALLYPEFADRFILGHEPAAAAAFACLAILNGVGTVDSLLRLRCVDTAIPEMTWTNMAQSRTVVSPAVASNWSMRWWMGSWDAALDRCRLVTGRDGLSQRMRHWRLGNMPVRLVATMLMMVLTMVVMGTAMQLASPEKNLALVTPAYVIMGSWMGAMTTSIYIVQTWWERLRVLSSQSLVPRRRRQIMNDLLLVFLRDAITIALLAAVFGIVGFHLLGEVKKIHWLWDSALLSLVILAGTLGAGGLLIVTRRFWLSGILMVVGTSAVGFVISSLTAWSDLDSLRLIGLTFAGLMLIPMVIAMGMWRDYEFGRLND